MSPTHKPAFVVIEGLDGAGTTTQASELAATLRSRDLQVCLTAEPSQGPIGRLVRTHVRGEITLDPLAATLAFCADRADHLTSTVIPALQTGQWVVCDRYLLSTLAYQGAGGVDRDWIMSASTAVLRPDLTIYLDLDEHARRGRLSARETSDRYDSADMSVALRHSYEASIEVLRDAGHRIEVVDANADVAEVHRRICGFL